jgi:hypothetical protein
MDLARQIVQAAREKQPRVWIQVAAKGKGTIVMHLSKNDDNKVVMTHTAAGYTWKHVIPRSWNGREIRDLVIDTFMHNFVSKHPLGHADCTHVKVQLMHDHEEVLGLPQDWEHDYHVARLKNNIRNLFDYFSLSL